MTEQNLEWRRLDREMLPALLMHSAASYADIGMRLPDIQHAAGVPKTALIAALTAPTNKNEPQRLIGLYLDSAMSRDFFAWVSTYVPSICPITQMCRVLPVSDLELFRNDNPRTVSLNYLGAWAGTVLGECLAQLGQEPSLKSATLNAASATFSLPVARFHALWAKSVEFSVFADRLRTTVDASNGLDRRLSVDQMQGVWAVLRALERPSYKGALDQSQQAIVDVCERIAHSSGSSLDLASLVSPFLRAPVDFQALNNATAEERLSFFDRILDLQLSASGISQQDSGAFAISLAAWAVGLGDAKHIALLWPAAERAPILLVWFCLLVGLRPKASESDDFVGLLRLVEREVLYSFVPSDPPRADIGYLEYAVYQAPEFGNLIKDLRRSQARSLSIELFPGVLFVRGFAADSSSSRTTGVTSDGAAQMAKRMATFDEVMASLWALRNEFFHQMISSKPQSDLFPTDGSRGKKKKQAADK